MYGFLVCRRYFQTGLLSRMQKSQRVFIYSFILFLFLFNYSLPSSVLLCRAKNWHQEYRYLQLMYGFFRQTFVDAILRLMYCLGCKIVSGYLFIRLFLFFFSNTERALAVANSRSGNGRRARTTHYHSRQRRKSGTG